jgi:opacity protein-like surface antigen/outer membrane protein OmpA-like peptidoglycan-associated protein
MKQKLLIAAAAAAMMATPSIASAQDVFDNDQPGWYLKAQTGYGTHTDMEATGLIDSSQHGNGIQAEGNGALNLGLGYDFGESWRIELDGTTMFNDHGSISSTPSSFAKLRTNALMINALYDFDEFGRWEPYVGAGAGVIRADASLAAHDFPNVDADGQIRNPTCVGSRATRDGFSCDVNDRDIGLGYQLLAGLGYAITDKLSWDTNYRFMQALGDMKFDASITNAATGEFNPGTVRLDDIGAHQLLTGFRYKFGEAAAPTYVAPTPPPPPPPVKVACWDGSMVFNSSECPAQPPAPVVVEAQPQVQCWDGTLVFDATQCPAEPPRLTCPDGSIVSDLNFCPSRDTSVTLGDICGEQYRQEIIYYEFDQGTSAETRNTISRILDAGQFCDVQNIRVVGHTDTSGAASYNLALSKRRATDALNELVRQGMNRNLITAEGKGETEPFVQTGDGVKEQLNRRTEVLITLGSVGVIN